MENIKIKRAEFWLFIATSFYFLMNGAQLWETAIMVPAWTAAPPQSLHFFSGPYGVDFKWFWILVHSIHEVFLLLALIFNWQLKKRRNIMIVLLAVHIAIRVWTLQYFAPTIIEFQALQASSSINQQLVDKASNWRNLNYLRVGLFFLVNIGYAYLLTLNSKRNNQCTS